ncbi:MAG: hypothetical protein VXX56_01170 [Pseudomonadota bacterium]|nr:hypothetical protein [Pseudomonadota bacterium]MEE3008450.1 hypothetical protein [Pseudomonadota bacterium]
MKSSLAKPKTQAGIFKTELHLQHHPPQKNTVREPETKLGLLIDDPG